MLHFCSQTPFVPYFKCPKKHAHFCLSLHILCWLSHCCSRRLSSWHYLFSIWPVSNVFVLTCLLRRHTCSLKLSCVILTYYYMCKETSASFSLFCVQYYSWINWSRYSYFLSIFQKWLPFMCYKCSYKCYRLQLSWFLYICGNIIMATAHFFRAVLRYITSQIAYIHGSNTINIAP